MARRSVSASKAGAALYLQERYAAYSASLQISSDVDQKLGTILQLGSFVLTMQGLMIVMLPDQRVQIIPALVASLVLLALMVARACKAWWPVDIAVAGTSDWEKAQSEFVYGPTTDYEAIKQAISNSVEARRELGIVNLTKLNAVKFCIVLFGLQTIILIGPLLWLLCRS